MLVKRHRIGDQMPRTVHPRARSYRLGPLQGLGGSPGHGVRDPLGSRAAGGWDEQSDLDMIIIHPSAGDDEGKRAVCRKVGEAKERHYPGYRDYESPHYEVTSGQMAVTPEEYRSRRRTLNHVMARAAREGRIFTRDPKDEDRYRHDGDVSNEWDLVTRKCLRRAYDENRALSVMGQLWDAYPIDSVNVNTLPGRNAHRLLWNSGAALLSILGVIYPRGLGGRNGKGHCQVRRRMDLRVPRRSGTDRPVLRLRVRGGGDRPHRGRSGAVARPGGGPVRTVGTYPRTQRI